MPTPELTEDVLKEAVRAYNKAGRNLSKAARELGISREKLRYRLAKAKARGIGSGNASYSREEFLEVVDWRRKLEAVVDGVLSRLSADEIIGDQEMRVVYCGVGNNGRWREVTRKRKYDQYRFVCGRRVWWARKETVKWALANVTGARPYGGKE